MFGEKNKTVIRVEWIALVVAFFALTVSVAGFLRENARIRAEDENEQNYSTPNFDTSQESSERTVMASEDHLYTIREYKGHIGVFLSGRDLPYLEIDTLVRELPEYDRELLQKGIYADSRAELIKILEDYDG